MAPLKVQMQGTDICYQISELKGQELKFEINQKELGSTHSVVGFAVFDSSETLLGEFEWKSR